jgi:hypothetical protein
MNKQLELYISQHYYDLLKVAKKYTKNDDWASELLHEVIIQLYNKKEWNTILDNNKNIKYYIVRCLMVNWCYPSSPFFRKYKMNELNTVQINEVIDMVKEDCDIDSHKLLDIIEIEWAEINWFNKIIFEKYLILGSMKKVAIDTTISIASIGRYIKDTKETIKTKTLIKFNNE